MRRKDKKITNPELIQSIIRKSIVCRLGMVDGNQPYVVPLNFGYENNRLYFHCAKDGKKVDILKINNDVCFEFDIDQEVVPSDNACKFGMKYQSVIGFGKALFVEDDIEKQKALDIIMRQYSDKDYDFTKELVQNILIIKVEIETITGKQAGI
jgi:nitroimidazol reductase NimA-like FMN-containing flavoprotein (pyridoxamine 5'-phosphate oxidase superfamily)